MSENNTIQHLTHAEIDKTKWDACIDKADNGLIYANSVYLDKMCNSQWDALIMGDYQTVMPLTWRKKWGIHYLYQPAFTQQLGIFSISKPDELLVQKFITAIPDKYLLIDINLNSKNNIPTSSSSHKNYLLDINHGYEELKKNYSRSAIRNINKAIHADITIQEDVSASEIISIHRKRFRDKIGTNANDYAAFNKLVSLLVNQKRCLVVGAFDSNSKLIAGSIYLKYKNRITFIINGNSPESLHCGATHLLKDYTIHKFSNQGFTMDFEGSDFIHFARFYEQFGNVYIEHYPSFFLNKLPWPIKLLKRNVRAVTDLQ